MVRNVLRVVVCALFCSSAAVVAWADGAVYSMTNALGNNQVLVYHRGADGNLTATPVQTIATGGGGSGLQLAGVDAMGSAGSIQLSPDHHLLFVVNTESAAENNGAGAYNTDCRQGTITSFLVGSDGTLTFADRVFSRGLFPNSLTVAAQKRDDDDRGRKGNDDDDNDRGGDVLYVLNAGGPEAPAICNNQPASANTPNITGFKVDRFGRMNPLLGSTQSIDPGPATGSGENCSAASAAGFSGLTGAPAADFQCGLNPPSFARSPAQVRFDPDADKLVVTVKGTNTIYVFRVDDDGRAVDPVITQAPGPALPSFFGFTFDRHENMLVTELFGSATSIPAGATGAVSSFSVSRDGDLTAISSHVNDGGTAACWIALEPSTGRFAYVANNLSASISSYSVSNAGTVTLINGVATGASGPNDLAIAREGGSSFLYAVEAGNGTVGAFQINLVDGSLTPLSGGMGLPAGRSAQGLAAY
jgi:6-phosphogluconolactonase